MSSSSDWELRSSSSMDSQGDVKPRWEGEREEDWLDLDEEELRGMLATVTRQSNKWLEEIFKKIDDMARMKKEIERLEKEKKNNWKIGLCKRCGCLTDNA